MEKSHPLYGESKKPPKPPYKPVYLTDREKNPLGTDQTGKPLSPEVQRQIDEINGVKR